jgi:hypothetical protein
MSKKPETITRVPEITGDRLGYLAGSLAMTQGAIVEMVVVKGMQDAKSELDVLVQAFLNGDHEEILKARDAVIEKMKPQPQEAQ